MTFARDSASPPVAKPVSETAYREYFAGLLSGNRPVCRTVFEECLAAEIELRDLYDQLVRHSLYEIGDLWERGRISVATEHLATAITESLLPLTYPRLFARPRADRSVVVACVPNEYHQIGGKMAADLFEWHGWRGYFLGANTPTREMLQLIEEKRPDAVGLSVAVAFNFNALLEAARQVRAAFPELPILVGGQALRWGGLDRIERIPGARCLLSLEAMEQWIREEGGHG